MRRKNTETPTGRKNLRRVFSGRPGPCSHVLSGRFQGPKMCIFNGECYHCPFDQILDHMDFRDGLEMAGA